VDQAIACWRRAIAADPKDAAVHTNLGLALHAKGEVDQAIACWRRAVAADPKHAQAHYNLGVALHAKGEVDQAIACWRRAIAADPKYARAHYNLGLALEAKGEVEQAIACFRGAIAADPKLAQAHTNLGLALQDKGELTEAIDCFRRAIALDPKYAQAHGALGQALLHQGLFVEAGAASRRCLDLLPPAHPLRNLVARQLQQCQRLLQLDDRLAAVRRAEATPRDAAERLNLASLCQQPYKRLYASAARLYADAFTERPVFADDLSEGWRYNAACAAALAAAGQGKDAGSLDEKERTRLRAQALDWLRADLAAWTALAEKTAPQARQAVEQALSHWRKEPSLAGVRDPAALAGLPQPERAAWRKLWAEVDELLRRAATGE
jgi:Tfp pilus assembly protein PilF